MNVAINAQLLSLDNTYRGAGVSNYSRHLLTALGTLASTKEHADLTLTAFVNSPAFQANGIELICSRLPLHRPLARIAWEQTLLPLALRVHKADLVHGFVNVLPLAASVLGGKQKGIPGIVTVHDLSFIRTPENLPAAKRWYLARLCRASVAKAQHVIAVSRQTADDLVTYFELPAAKISIVHNGVAPACVPQSANAVAALRQRHHLPARFFLYLGTLEPRKNLPLLIRAYARCRAQAKPGERDLKLVLAGGKGWFYEEIFQLVTELELTTHILFPGFIPDADLPTWYSAATAFVYPSRLEGFGLPVLEAMACGTPVLCSDIAILREIADDHALFFPIDGEAQLADLFQRVLTESSLRATLQQRGRTHAANFSWYRAAAATIALYRQI